MISQAKTETDGTLVVTVMVNALDRSNAAEFREFAAPLAAAATGRPVVDCTQIEFIDSSGLGALIYVQKQLPEGLQPLRLTGVGPRMLTVLELLQVHRLFDIEPRN
jgi:anti-sigma B factor antagonist